MFVPDKEKQRSIVVLAEYLLMWVQLLKIHIRISNSGFCQDSESQPQLLRGQQETEQVSLKK